MIGKDKSYKAGLFLTLTGLALLLGCSNDPVSQTEKESIAMESEIEKTVPNEQTVVADDHYRNGFNLLGVRSIETGDQVMDVLNYGQEYGVYPLWRLAQWGTRHSLEGTEVQVAGEGIFSYSNRAKAVTADTNTGEVILKATASEEYERPRKQGEDWPHLLMEQYFLKPAFVKDLQELRVRVSVRISEFERKMTDAEYDPALHAAQVSWYLTIQNQNSSSGKYGDYYWFGLPIFDNRDSLPEESYFQDGGKADTTSKFIYNMPAKAYLTKGLEDGEWATIDLDVLPYVLKAKDLAYRSGFLQGTEPDDLALSNMNIGWDLPGTFDVEMRMKDLQIIAKLKESPRE